MIASSAPAPYQIPFANGAGSGYVRSIPQPSQVGITPGAASLYDGFPPLNFTPIATGGIPPSGQDMNGVLNGVTKAIQWLQAGGLPVYNATFSAAIGGYPNGAILVNAAGTAFWHSTVDNNLTNPDAGGANWTALGATSSLAWTAITGRPTALSAFTNDVGFLALSNFSGSNQSLASSGYQKLPGGLILQWGTGTDAGTAVLNTFPLTFPNACLVVQLTHKSPSINTGLFEGAVVDLAPTATGYYAYNGNGATAAHFFTAIGY